MCVYTCDCGCSGLALKGPGIAWACGGGGGGGGSVVMVIKDWGEGRGWRKLK